MGATSVLAAGARRRPPHLAAWAWLIAALAALAERRADAFGVHVAGSGTAAAAMIARSDACAHARPPAGRLETLYRLNHPTTAERIAALRAMGGLSRILPRSSPRKRGHRQRDSGDSDHLPAAAVAAAVRKCGVNGGPAPMLNRGATAQCPPAAARARDSSYRAPASSLASE